MGDGIGVAFWLAVGLPFAGVTFGPIGKAIGRAEPGPQAGRPPEPMESVR